MVSQLNLIILCCLWDTTPVYSDFCCCVIVSSNFLSPCAFYFIILKKKKKTKTNRGLNPTTNHTSKSNKQATVTTTRLVNFCIQQLKTAGSVSQYVLTALGIVHTSL